MKTKSRKILSLLLSCALLCALVVVAPQAAQAATAISIAKPADWPTGGTLSLNDGVVLTIGPNAGSPAIATTFNIGANANVTIIGNRNMITNLRIAESASDTVAHTVTINNLAISAPSGAAGLYAYDQQKGVLNLVGDNNFTGNGTDAALHSASTVTIDSARGGTLLANGNASFGINTYTLNVQGSAQVYASTSSTTNPAIQMATSGITPSISVAANAALTVNGSAGKGIYFNAAGILYINCDGVLNITGLSNALYSMGNINVTGAGTVNATVNSRTGGPALATGTTGAFNVDATTVDLTCRSSASSALSTSSTVTLNNGATLNVSGSPAADSTVSFTMNLGTAVALTNSGGSDETHSYLMASAAPTGSMWSLIDGAGFAGSSTAVSNPASVTTWADATGTVKLLSPVSFTATQVEGTSGVSNSLGIQITFNKAVSGLTASDIKLIDATIFFYDYTGAATTGTLTGSGTTWVISLTRVASEGTADVLITDFGQYHIINNPQSIMVYKDSNIAHLPAAAAIANQVYTGAALKPVPVIKDGSKTLVNGSDFTLAYASNTAVGTATITVTGIGAYSGTTTVSFKIVPATPALASLANSTTGPLLKWNKAAGATGYYVLRKTGTGSWASIKKITAAATVSYTDTTAVSGTAYSYSVQAYGGASSLAGSYNTTGKTITYVATPKLTSAVNVTTGVKFTWGKVSGATGYLIYRKTGTGAWVKVKTITSAATVAWTDTAVKSGTTYTYTAYAYKTSSANKSACNATGKKVVYVATPKLVSLANSKSGPVFKWGKVTGATGYIVLRKTTGGWSTIATIKSGSTVSYTDKKAAKGKTYSYTVRAYKTSTANISAYNATGKKIKVKK